MPVLVLVFAGCVLALLWATWAIRRSIRRHGSRRAEAGLGLDARYGAKGHEDDAEE